MIIIVLIIITCLLH